MKLEKKEAVAIAQILGADRKQCVGWIYLWDTSELSILWIDQHRSVEHIEPPLGPETLARAKVVTTDAVTDLLEALSADGVACPR